MITYAKSVMKISELKEMGFTEEWLLKAARQRNRPIAWKMSNAKNSPFLFDTNELEKYRLACCGLGRGIERNLE